MTRKILLMLVICLASASSALLALGLGEIKLKSGLNQPLDAEITLLSVRGESNDQLRGKLGTANDFERSGIERNYFLTKIDFNTITKPNGQKVLHLSTEEAVKEPFLNFLVDLEWPNGRLLREYTLLLDPPIFDDAPETTVTPAKAETEVKPQPAKPRPKTTYVAPKPQWEGDVYGPVSSDDTLWGIASKVRPNRSVSMQQAMITLFEANPDAFMRGNINNLKRGSRLRVPEEEQFGQISQREALRMIAAHNDNWKSGKKTPPRVVMDTSSLSSESVTSTQTTSDSGRLSLSIDSGENGTGGGNASSVLTEEENVILKQQNESLQEKTRTDAERIAQLERLLQLKDEQLANIQNRESAEAATTEVIETVTEEPVETVQAEEVVATEADADTVAPAEPVVAETKPTITDVTPVNAVPESHSQSMLDGLMKGQYNMMLGIAGLVVLLILLIVLKRRRNQGVDYHEAVAKVEPEMQETGATVEIADELPEIADDVLAETNQSVYEDNDLVSDESADPLGEADIYLAYGKFEQAESLLLKSLKSDPERLELKTKLLECYSETSEQDKFEALVADIKPQLDADSELNSFIKELYHTAWPQGTLFQTADETEAPGEFAEEIAEQADAEEQPEFYAEAETPVEETDEVPSTEEVFGESADEEDEFGALDATTAIDMEEPFEVDDSELGDFSDDDFDIDFDEDVDDVETQLDLARAYVEMGDAEGAQEIIKEILESGTEEQCEAAQKILDSLEN